MQSLPGWTRRGHAADATYTAENAETARALTEADGSGRQRTQDGSLRWPLCIGPPFVVLREVARAGVCRNLGNKQTRRGSGAQGIVFSRDCPYRLTLAAVRSRVFPAPPRRRFARAFSKAVMYVDNLPPAG